MYTEGFWELAGPDTTGSVHISNRNLQLFLREREPKSLEQASRLADQYKEARHIDIVSLTLKTTDRSRSQSNSISRSRSSSLGGQQLDKLRGSTSQEVLSTTNKES